MSIKHRVRDACIALLHWSGVSFVYRAWFRIHGPLVRIVVFHDVTDAVWFDALMKTLVGKYHLLTPIEFRERHFNDKKINVLVTFDDGYASWEHLVAPILEKHHIKAVFFINSGLLDVAEDGVASDTFIREQLMISPRDPLTWKGAVALSEAGHTIGSHAQHHKNLAKLAAEEVQKELMEDKVRIERAVGVTVTECAYPFGTRQHVTQTVEEVARNVGFLRGYTAVSHFVGKRDVYRIPRTCIENGATPSTLRQWVEGSYDLFDMIKNVCVR